MQIKQISKLAEALVFVHGDHARDEAIRMADLNERFGSSQWASDWRKTVVAVGSAKSNEIRNAA
jgi:hypothetical protein